MSRVKVTDCAARGADPDCRELEALSLRADSARATPSDIPARNNELTSHILVRTAMRIIPDPKCSIRPQARNLQAEACPPERPGWHHQVHAWWARGESGRSPHKDHQFAR